MRNFNKSDYALNKYSEGIVYQFVDGHTEVITLEDFLASNQSKTAEDFEKLKALSDEVYYKQDLEETRHGKRRRSLDLMTEQEHPTMVSIDTELIHKADKQDAMKATELLLNNDYLTEVQQRRFILHFYQGLSYRKIAEQESVHFTSVQESIEVAIHKLKKIYRKI